MKAALLTIIFNAVMIKQLRDGCHQLILHSPPKILTHKTSAFGNNVLNVKTLLKAY